MFSIITQIIGLLAMSVSVLSFQKKTQKEIVILQSISTVLWCSHFLMLGAYTGSMLNLIAATRNLLLTQREKRPWTRSPLVVLLVAFASCLVYALSFLVFGVKPTCFNLFIEILPVIGMVATSLSVREKEAKNVRLFALISSPLWLIYNVMNHSIGGSITETFSIASIVIAYLRLDRKKERS